MGQLLTDKKDKRWLKESLIPSTLSSRPTVWPERTEQGREAYHQVHAGFPYPWTHRLFVGTLPRPQRSARIVIHYRLPLLSRHAQSAQWHQRLANIRYSLTLHSVAESARLMSMHPRRAALQRRKPTACHAESKRSRSTLRRKRQRSLQFPQMKVCNQSARLDFQDTLNLFPAENNLIQRLRRYLIWSRAEDNVSFSS